ncbi:MAG TPA: TauD/TfdA family dioxygenase [Burkholderiales bacterium]|nr:TauD/TfdA family dioxygenase [Burkholderiales bacterium]
MLQIKKIAGALGAEIVGADLSERPSSELASAIRGALLEHLVVFLQDQRLTVPQFLAFARCFGKPIEYPLIKGLPEFPEVIEVSKLENETANFGGVWHTDTAYLELPPMGSMLLAREVPPVGGDTLFANQYLAYEALSPGLRRMLEGLVAVNSSTKADASRTREDRVRKDGREDAKAEYLAEHPVVRTHPETGRKALYVNVAHTVRFKGLTDEESAPLLNYIFQHQTRPEFTCRFSWQVGSLAFWDNRCALHNAVNDYHGHRRVMHRITLAGDKPR